MTQPSPAQTAANLCMRLHPIGNALIDTATHLATIKELLPARGELVDEFRELVTLLAYVEQLYRDADEELARVAFNLRANGTEAA